MSTSFLARGVGASPGKATGAIVFKSEDAVAYAKQNRPAILVRIETTPEDVPGVQAATGIVTTRGGLTGDAAIVARTLGKPCIAGCFAMRVDYVKETLTIVNESEAEDIVLLKGETMTIDGATGEIWRG